MEGQEFPATENAAADIERLVLVVVGAHLRAEAVDRPLAYRMRDRIVQWQNENRARGETEDVMDGKAIRPIVCTDLWYLNDQALLGRPAICVGQPAVNAATAYLSNRLPTAFVVENKLRVHIDLEFIDRQACIWGVDGEATAAGVELFAEKYLDSFLRGTG